jgi:DeoR/GlpR family transcriptional regulator of sugar metabolism
MNEADFARAAAGQADYRIVVADAGKFGMVAPIIVDTQDGYDLLVTDAEPPGDIRQMLEKHDIRLTVAGQSNDE